jgi:hypothetical protein
MVELLSQKLDHAQHLRLVALMVWAEGSPVAEASGFLDRDAWDCFVQEFRVIGGDVVLGHLQLGIEVEMLALARILGSN